MLSKVGVAIELSPIESANFIPTLAAGDFDLADFVTSVFSDATGATLLFSSEGLFNVSHYSNVTIDTELAAASTTTDTSERAERFQKVADAMVADSAVAWFTAANAGVISSQSVTGIPDVSKLTLVSINPKTIGRTA